MSQDQQASYARRARQTQHLKIQRTRRLIKNLKWLFPLLISLSVFVLIAWPQVQSILAAKLKEKKGAESSPVLGHQGLLVKPLFQSQTIEGRPFTIEADTALAIGEQDAHLDMPKGEIILEDDQSFYLKAGKGTYSHNCQTLKLYEGGTVQDAKGNIFHFESSEVFLKEGRVVSHTPVHGSGPLGTIEADSFEVRENGDKVVFKGKAKIAIIPQNNTQP
jgi:lipopolysaccharide export system protein LptC